MENNISRMKVAAEDSSTSLYVQTKLRGQREYPLSNSSMDSRSTPISPRKRTKRVSSATLFRTMAAVLATMSVCRTLFYGRDVSSQYWNARKVSNIEYYFGKAFPISAQPHSDSVPVLYSEEFQQLQKNFSFSTPATDSWPTLEEKLQIRDNFRRHNRQSIYSLLLLPPDEDMGEDENSETQTKNNAVMQWGSEFYYIFEHLYKRNDQALYEFHDVWGIGMDEKDAIKHRKDPKTLHAAWDSGAKNSRLIHEHNLCHALRHARDIADFKTPHVLISHLNENWGTLSSEIPDRTHDWGDILKHWEEAKEVRCDPMEVKEYLDSPQTLAVFTTQHQALFDHPKVFSIPIGVANSRNGGKALLKRLLRQQRKWKMDKEQNPRTRLLMINSSPSPTRGPQMNAVIRNFKESGHPEGQNIQNMYGKYEGGYEKQRNQYYADISNSKFILCPSGIGWDTYRIWESIVLGAIPVIERHKYKYGLITYPPSSGMRNKLVHIPEENTPKSRKLDRDLRRHNGTLRTIEYFDGWQKSLDDLPVLWIDGEFGDKAPEQGKNDRKSYLTPQFLEEQYDRLAARAGDFRYEKLTSLYWLQFIESFLLQNKVNDALWHRSLETLSSTFNDHSWTLEQYVNKNAMVQKENDDDDDDEHQQRQVHEQDSSDYLFGSLQPKILSWVLLLELKLVGLVLIVIAVRRLDSSNNKSYV